MGNDSLTPRQMRAIQRLLECRSIETGCAAAKISRSTYYTWMEQAPFRAELDRQRAELATQGLALLAQSVAKAVETLVGLLDSGDSRLRRLAARDILTTYLKHKELDELTRRLEAVEGRLDEQQGNHTNGYDPELEKLSLEELKERLAALRRMASTE